MACIYIAVPPTARGEVSAAERLPVEVPCVLFEDACKWIDKNRPGWSLFAKVERSTNITLSPPPRIVDPWKEYHAGK